ncbi:hypothetical protein ACFWMR_04345 [Amycolatopsis thailandensis]|uniref:hypothetical protein n=1 Tax=Amycolatopsis thailandensis TaxID=589330 RepID=UPI00366082D0
MYEIGGNEDTHFLKGITRPVKRIIKAMKESGELPQDASDLLTPIYDGMTAVRFEVPDGLAVLLL